jgi:Amt family ammonium transporter
MFVYPVVTAWCWNTNGWLYEQGYHDFAGTGCIHLTAGIGGLIGAVFTGKRFLKSNIDVTEDLKTKTMEEKSFKEVIE